MKEIYRQSADYPFSAIILPFHILKLISFLLYHQPHSVHLILHAIGTTLLNNDV